MSQLCIGYSLHEWKLSSNILNEFDYTTLIT